MLRRKEISSRELTEMLFTRIEAVNPGLNAVVELRREKAVREAAAADELLARGGAAGPLHGVPMTMRDSFNVTGLHTTWGNPAFKDYVADSDATVVRRLRRAGADSQRALRRDHNPWDTRYTPGGSTGGAAAALAAGMTFPEYGTDSCCRTTPAEVTSERPWATAGVTVASR